MRALVLVDGEHYPSTTRWGLDTARALGFEAVACLLAGGFEKLGADRALDLGDLPVEVSGGSLREAVTAAIGRHRPEVVLDLSDEPVLGYRERMEVAAVVLAAGLRYVGPDFILDPPVRGASLPVPTLAVIGTGKRSGKTAVAGEAARMANGNGLRPVVVAMGRGGPPGPQVVEAGTATVNHLLALVEAGEHAASDYLEDAVTTGVTTVGARRVGGGLAGRPFATNVREAAEAAAALGPGLVVLEGSGAAVPPVPWDAGVLVCQATLPQEYLGGYLGPYRVLLSDLVVFTMSRGPQGGPRDLSDLISHVRRLRPEARIAVTDLRPVCLGEVKERKVFFTTTAAEAALPELVASLEASSGCAVVGASHRLGDRAGLDADLRAAPAFDVLATELKAGAVDVAAVRARERGAEIVFVDNRPETLDGDGDVGDLLLETARMAVDRAKQRYVG
jgi:cyclic 2,3-diphosphoglycerate synthase